MKTKVVLVLLSPLVFLVLWTTVFYGMEIVVWDKGLRSFFSGFLSVGVFLALAIIWVEK